MAKGIYCYIDNKNNKIVYVGKDSNIDKQKRRRDHLAPSNYNAQPINRILQNNPDRYIYQVLWEIGDCTDNHLNQMEIFYIKKYDPQFNFTDGGDGSSGFEHSEESRKKISENNARYWQGKTLSEETRKKISEANKGENNSMYGKKGKNHPMYGKRHSEETKRKISEASKGENHPMYGKKHSEETKKKISESTSEAQNTTGFYRVSKQKDNTCKQGFRWCYRYHVNSQRKSISSIDLKKLEKKVKAQNLPWKIIDDEKAQNLF